MLKSQTVAEKTAKTFRGPLFSAAPCRYNLIVLYYRVSECVRFNVPPDTVQVISGDGLTVRRCDGEWYHLFM